MKRFNPPPYAVVAGHLGLALAIYLGRDWIAWLATEVAHYAWIGSILYLLGRAVVLTFPTFFRLFSEAVSEIWNNYWGTP